MKQTREDLQARIEELEDEVAALRAKTGDRKLDLDAGGQLVYEDKSLSLRRTDGTDWFIEISDIPAIQDFLEEVQAAADGE